MEESSVTTQRQQELIAGFRGRFGRRPFWIAEAPGRVNLIGEHTDYNDGFVLPVAIDRTALVAAAPSEGQAIRLWSMELRAESRFSPLHPELSCDQPWSNYVRGAVWALRDAGHDVPPVDLVIQSSVPMGAGLSSSAALEVAATLVLATAIGAKLSLGDIAQLAHRAETDFVGVPCGIMDQFISALAVEDNALLIDCRTLEAEPVQLDFQQQGIALMVVESGVSRELVHSAYKQRRMECEEAMKLLHPWLPEEARSLRDVTPEQLAEHAGQLPHPLLNRARHVVTENRRVLQFALAVREHRLGDAGALMRQSHRSLRDDYEVSTPELDLLVDLANDAPYVIGSRLTGAGFGGCTVSLVRDSSLELFQRQVVEEYRRRTGLVAKSFHCRVTGGAALVPVPNDL
jgi:galactokinase